MAASQEFVQFILDQLQPLGRLSTRRMFGCIGVFIDGIMFALLDGDDVFYIKADAQSLPQCQAAGCRPLVYQSRGRNVTLSYQALPDSVLDDREALLDWARLGVAAAMRAAERAAGGDGPSLGKARRRPGA